ncbi:hypothetical protein Dsin_028497 [Dipteronia sinensis]|uniref:Reverse transcriptase zinc-binding domain-containing protein n=1 Tax=Dipteronia sinensis TaxID=43782 RepID=A0AAE0DUK8_9ROSI|nr:hypothetical protein Dsin_028497 [Dipteronia sinensis]
MSVLINGSPSKQFPIGRGLRQDDPMSPFLFNLVVEIPSGMLVQARELGLIRGSIFECNKRILRCFRLVCGLKINFHKSCLVRIGKKRCSEEDWAAAFRCASASLPVTYLGLPLGGNSKRESFWNPVVSKVEHRLAPWKRAFISKGGRLVLIKAVLSSLPSYFMFGGLGVGRMRDNSLSLMAKWLWRYGSEEDSLWNMVLCAKYNLSANPLLWDCVKFRSGSSFVKNISRLYRAANIVKNGLQMVIGRGDEIRLWQDVKWDSVPFMRAFPRIYVLASNKIGCVNEFGSWGLCPPKVEVFVWQLLKGWVLVIEVLLKFGVAVQMASSGCPMCDGGSESIDHVFLLCEWSSKVWRVCMGWWGVNGKALDTIKFRVALWFKNHGCSSEVDLSLLVLDIKERYVDSCVVKLNRVNSGMPLAVSNLYFFVDGSSRGNPGDAGICGVLRDHGVAWYNGEDCGNLYLLPSAGVLFVLLLFWDGVASFGELVCSLVSFVGCFLGCCLGVFVGVWFVFFSFVCFWES